MVVAGDFKNGVTFDMECQVMQVIEFQHVKPGKGAAFVRTKLRNVITGAVVEKTFSPTDKYQDARIDRKEMQYLYNDGDLYYFMDMKSYEQVPLGTDIIGDSLKFVKEEMICKIN
ncbi:MAG: elongation factor P, partial [Clostridia bacterium]|nr:elongation factor P [Clostridia bacterium]